MQITISAARAPLFLARVQSIAPAATGSYLNGVLTVPDDFAAAVATAQAAPLILSAPMTVAAVGLFVARLRTAAPGAEPSYHDGVLSVADPWIDAAQALISGPALTYTAAELAAYAAAVRYTKETAGTTVNGMPVATDRQSQAMLSGAFAMAQADATFTTQWKGPSGAFASLDAPTIIAVAKAVGAYVASCFAKEASADAAITAGTIKTYADVDAAFA